MKVFQYQITITNSTPYLPKIMGSVMSDNENILSASWPITDETSLSVEEIEIIVQVNGKLRARIIVQTDSNQNSIEDVALSHENVSKFADKDNIHKIILPDKLINFVTQ